MLEGVDWGVVDYGGRLLFLPKSLSPFGWRWLWSQRWLPPSVRALLSTSRVNFDGIFALGLDYDILLVSRIANLRL